MMFGRDLRSVQKVLMTLIGGNYQLLIRLNQHMVNPNESSKQLRLSLGYEN